MSKHIVYHQYLEHSCLNINRSIALVSIIGTFMSKQYCKKGRGC